MNTVPLSDNNNDDRMPKLQQLLARLLEVYTQEELARALGVSSKTVYNYTNGIAPRKDTLKRIIDLHEQLTRTGEPRKTFPTTVEERLDDIEQSLMFLKLDAVNLTGVQLSLQIIEAMVKSLTQHLLKLRAQIEGQELLDLQLEMNKDVAECLKQIQQEDTGDDSGT